MPSSTHAGEPALETTGLDGRAFLLMWILSAAMFLDSMGVSLMSIAVPSAARDLGMSDSTASWMLSGYTVAFGGLLLFGGRLVDVRGHRPVFLSGMALLAGGGLLSGVGTTAVVVILGRIVSGVGAALVAPAALATLLDRFRAPEARATAIRAYSGAGALGYGAGLIISGALTSLDWRATVTLPALLAVAVMIAGARVIPRSRAAFDTRSLDPVGSASVSLALMLAVYTVVTVPESGWTALTVSVLVGAVLAGGAFVVVERHHPDALLPRRLATSRTLVPGNVLAFLWASASIGWQFLASLFLSERLAMTPLLAGLAILPLAITIVATQVVTTNWLRLTHPRLIGAVGMTIQGLGILWFVAGVYTNSYWYGALPGLLLHGLGNGLVFPTFYTQGTSGVPEEDEGVASALVNTSVQVGSGFGVAVASALHTWGPGSNFSAGFAGVAVFSLLGALWSLARLRQPST